ncbi:MAG: alternative ribosome rescue aminoacyl-tRNA hydrolase ArfB [Patescibacteria group bacterium]
MSKRIPESEISVSAARATGPGGQKVNKTSSKAVLHWSVNDSTFFTDNEKRLIRLAAGNALTIEGKITLSERQSRSWHQNRKLAIERLQQLVAKALRPKKKRVATHKPRRADEQRLQTKREQAFKKQARRPTKED